MKTAIWICRALSIIGMTIAAYSVLVNWLILMSIPGILTGGAIFILNLVIMLWNEYRFSKL